MKSIFITSLFLLSFASHASQELKDPRTRDNDISRTSVDVSVTRTESGFYQYVYTLTADEANMEVVTDFIVDIACEEPAPEVSYPEPPTSLRWDYASRDRKHAPVQIYPSPTGSAWMSLGVWNRINFSVNMDPGEFHTGFRILSPYPPVDRPFQLRPNWTVGNYDYSDLTDEEWDQLPIRDDFWVEGMTKGPGCSPAPEPPALFPGTRNEPDEDLLQYAEPDRSAFHTDEDTLVMDVHYADDLLPESFKVEPAWARKLFTPVAGAHQRVELKLHPGMNRFKLYAERASESPETRRGPKASDTDTFAVRRVIENNGKGKDNSREAGK